MECKTRLPLGSHEGSSPLLTKGSPTTPENSSLLPMGLRVPASKSDRSSKGFMRSWNVLDAIPTDLQCCDLTWSETASDAKVGCPGVSGHGRGYDMQDYIEIHSGSFYGSLSVSLDIQISQPLSSDVPARSGSGFYPSLRSDLGSTARNLSKVSRFYPIRSDFYLSARLVAMKRAGDHAIPMQSDGRTVIGSQHLFGTDIGELLLGYCHIGRSSVGNAIRGWVCYLEPTKFGMVGRNRTSNPAVEKICVFGEWVVYVQVVYVILCYVSTNYQHAFPCMPQSRKKRTCLQFKNLCNLKKKKIDY